jgi:hypothetical protein
MGPQQLDTLRTSVRLGYIFTMIAPARAAILPLGTTFWAFGGP